jgi:hypothetical protein
VRFLSVVPRSEEQRFGIVLATALCLIAVSNIFKGADRLISGSLFAGSALAIVITIGYPELLRPLYRGWQRLGRILGLIVSPIVLGLIFFGLITPVAIALRLCGRDELRLRRLETGSYWVPRTYPLATRDSFKRPY